MRRTPGVVVSVSLCLLALAGGCDSDDGDGTLPSVTIREFNKRCEELDAWAKTLKLPDEETCTSAKYASIFKWVETLSELPTDAELRQRCEQERTACLAAVRAAASMPPPMTMPTDRLTCEVPPSTCTATLGEWDACQRSMPDQFKLYLTGLPTCDKITARDLGEILLGTKFEVDDSTACKTFAMKCSAMPTPSMSSMMMKK